MEQTIGALIREARLSQNLSVRGLAAAAGLSPSTLSNWETGKALPRIPELDAVLDALHCPESFRLEAYTRIDAPRSLVRLKETLPHGFRDGETDSAWFPSSGDLLRSLRLRRQLSLKEAAALLRVQPSTVSRWETAKMALPESALDGCCALLATAPEEREALRKTLLHLPQERESQSLTRDAIEQRFENLRADVIQGESKLIDLRALSMQAQLLQYSSQERWASHLLLQSYVWHAQWLQWQDRLGEAGHFAKRAVQMMQQEPHPHCFRAVHTYASYLTNGTKRPRLEYGMQFLLDWLPNIRQPQSLAWMHNNIALYQMHMGQVREALESVKKANSIAETTGSSPAIRNTRYDSAVVLLGAGQFEKAREMLCSSEQPNLYHRITEAHIWAQTSTALGDQPTAAHWLRNIQELLEKYTLPPTYKKRLLEQFNLPE